MTNEEKIIQKLVEIDVKIDALATNERVNTLEERMAKNHDDQLVILQRLDQERIFTLERIKRIEADVEQLKLQLQIA